jgi:putative aldouronate transport system permease protein
MNNARKRSRLKWSRFLPLYLLLMPGTLYILINNYIPMAGITVAFKQYNYQAGIWGSKFIGFKNFEFLFKSQDAWLITRNTIGYNLAFIVIGTFFSVMVAILMNEVTSKLAQKFYQTAILMPYLISIVIVSYLVYGFLSPETGYINQTILKALGLDPISWYLNAEYWPYILVIVNLWKWFGFNTIIFYATLVGIDSSYFESAAIDGAGKWKSILHITLPSLRPAIIILTLMSIGRIFYSDFGLFYQVPMNSGPLMDVTSTIDTYVYRGLMQTQNIGMASAAGVFQSLVGFILILFANYLVKRRDRDSALF